jgi:basic amino acid/polyamine antiporter, APA family
VTTAPARRLTLIGVVALAVGNMVGTSIWNVPAELAKVAGPLALVGWALTAAGYFFVARCYSRLGARWPKTGGPYVFAREAFGDFAGFQTVWSYWLSATIGNAVIVSGVVGYATGFTGAFDTPMGKFLLAQALLWGLCLLNIIGVRESARLQIVLMFVTVVPLTLGALAMLPSFTAANLHPFAPHGWGGLASACALIVWAYSGVESATVPADEVQDAGRTVQRGTMIGYWLATGVYALTAVAVAGVLSTAQLSGSERPIAEALDFTLGPWAGAIVGVAAIGSNIATLNGWILMAGRIPVTAAQDGLFFPALGRLHPKFGTPHIALLIGTAIPSLLMFKLFTESLLDVFAYVIRLAILTSLLQYLYTCAGEWMLSRRHPELYTPAEQRVVMRDAGIAFAFVLWTMYGTGPDAVFWGFLAILAGTPLYAWLRVRRPAVR